MGCVFAIARSVLALILGVAVFFGFLFLLLLNNFSDKLLSADFYTDIISGEDTYNRIYDEVLLDEELGNTTQALLGNVEVVSQEEVVGLLREVLPPSYLQSQLEGSIHRTVDYFNDDRDRLDVFIDLGPPLNNVKPVLFGYIDTRIDELELEELGTAECTPDRINTVAQRYQSRWEELGVGQVPTSIPSVANLTQACRGLIFDLAFSRLVASSTLDQRAKTGLLEAERDIEREFVFEADTHGVLKAAARPLADPLMDDAIARVREELDPQDRLDLIRLIALWNDNFTEAEFRSNLDTARDWVNAGRKFGKPSAWAMVIAGSILLGLIHWPSLTNALRWPGLNLFLTGLVFFIAGKVLESQVPDRLLDLVERGASQVTAIPPSVTDLGGDLLVSAGNQLTEGFAGPALVVLIIGAVLFAASIVVSFLGPPLILARIGFMLVRPFIRIFRRSKREPRRDPIVTPEPAGDQPTVTGQSRDDADAG